MKKLTALLLALVLLLALTPAVLADTEGSCGDNLTWKLEGNTLVITGLGEMYDYSGGAPWDEHKDSITALKMDGVTYIGHSAFKNYDNLRTIDFGSKVYEIGTHAFYDCDGLTSITLPASFKIFGEECFRGSSNLSQIHCSGGFPSFRNSCLWDCQVTIYYSLDRPWNTKNVHDLERAFQGRINFLAADGSDPHGDPEPETTPQPKPTEPPVTYPPATTAPPTTSPSEPDYTLPPETVPVTRQPVPTAGPVIVEKEEGLGGLAIAMLVLGVLALLAAGGLILWQNQQRKKRAMRKKRRRPTPPRDPKA